ncbi:MAG: PD40 domain-containing protein [Bacteroidia bacterium]|nr:PD40 domain-containing protein [Bacteroidia bacterium]
MKKKHSLCFLMVLALCLRSQVPNTDVWLFKLELNKQKETVLTEPFNVSNREGYDNQPSFSPDTKSLFYVTMKDDGQTDIYCYDLKSKINKPITRSKESEYSPSLVPSGKKLATVMVEKDSVQRIHLLNPELGFDDAKIDIDSVGYYTFINSDTLIYYKLTQPHSLRYYSQSQKEDKWLCNNPIRTFKMVNRHCVIYGMKDSASVTFYKYDFLLRKAVRYASYASTSEDIFWDEQLGLLKSEGTQILRYDEEKREWLLLYELSPFGIKKITRFCVDPGHKYLSVVNNL